LIKSKTEGAKNKGRKTQWANRCLTLEFKQVLEEFKHLYGLSAKNEFFSLLVFKRIIKLDSLY